jgi:hypothetical protein
MRSLEKDELYQNLSGFLKGKGIELKEGSYAHRIQSGCTLLSGAINLSRTGYERAKEQVGTRLDQVRQVIHEKTAPRPTAPKPTAVQPQKLLSAPVSEVPSEPSTQPSETPKTD